jgi:hypothetical protein
VRFRFQTRYAAVSEGGSAERPPSGPRQAVESASDTEKRCAKRALAPFALQPNRKLFTAERLSGMNEFESDETRIFLLYRRE